MVGLGLVWLLVSCSREDPSFRSADSTAVLPPTFQERLDKYSSTVGEVKVEQFLFSRPCFGDDQNFFLVSASRLQSTNPDLRPNQKLIVMTRSWNPPLELNSNHLLVGYDLGRAPAEFGGELSGTPTIDAVWGTLPVEGGVLEKSFGELNDAPEFEVDGQFRMEAIWERVQQTKLMPAVWYRSTIDCWAGEIEIDSIRNSRRDS
jgi:hypothetical protein